MDITVIILLLCHRGQLDGNTQTKRPYNIINYKICKVINGFPL